MQRAFAGLVVNIVRHCQYHERLLVIRVLLSGRQRSCRLRANRDAAGIAHLQDHALEPDRLARIGAATDHRRGVATRTSRSDEGRGDCSTGRCGRCVASFRSQGTRRTYLSRGPVCRRIGPIRPTPARRPEQYLLRSKSILMPQAFLADRPPIRKLDCRSIRSKVILDVSESCVLRGYPNETGQEGKVTGF